MEARRRIATLTVVVALAIAVSTLALYALDAGKGADALRSILTPNDPDLGFAHPFVTASRVASVALGAGLVLGTLLLLASRRFLFGLSGLWSLLVLGDLVWALAPITTWLRQWQVRPVALPVETVGLLLAVACALCLGGSVLGWIVAPSVGTGSLAPARVRLGDWIWVPVGLGTGAVLAMLLPPIPNSAVPLAGEGLVAIVLWVCFSSLARTDRAAFVSIALPAMGIALLGFVAPGRNAALFVVAAVVFFLLFEITDERFTMWWWRVVLRRPNEAFAMRFWAQLRRLDAASNPLTQHTLRDRERGLRDFARAVAGLRSPRPLSAKWGALRDAYVRNNEVWEQLLREDGPAITYVDAQARFVELRSQFRELQAAGSARPAMHANPVSASGRKNI